MSVRALSTVLLGLVLAVGCSRDPEVAKRRFVESGNKYFEQKKYKEASILYRRALEKDKKYGEANYRQALVELKLGNPQAAVSYLQRSIESAPENNDAHAQLINLYLAAYSGSQQQQKPKGLLEEVRRLADRMAKRDPNNLEAVRAYGYLAMADEDGPKALDYFSRVAKARPDQDDVQVSYVQALINAKRSDEAEKHALDFLSRKKDALGMYDLLILYYGSNKRMADVEAMLKRKAEGNPTLAGPMVDLARLYRQTNRPAEMEAMLQRIAASTQFENSRAIVGDFYGRLREFDKSRQQYEQGMRQDPKQANLYRRKLAELALVQSRPDEARRLVEEVLKNDPKDEDALAMRGGLSLTGANGDKAKLQAAIDDYQAVLARRKTDNLFFNLGRAYLALDKQSLARSAFEDSVKANPSFVPARLALAEMTLAEEIRKPRPDYGRVLKSADDVLQKDTNNVLARLIRTQSLMALGNVGQAKEELEPLVQAAPTLRDARFQLARARMSQRDHKGAEELLRQLEAENDPRAILGRVDNLTSQGQLPAALKLLQEASARSPERQELFAGIGTVAMATGNHDLAISTFTKMLEKQPKSAVLVGQLAEAYRRKGDLTTAIQQAERARQMDPENPTHTLHLAQLLEVSGRRAETKPLYEDVLKRRGDDPIAMNNLAYLLAESGQDLDNALSLAQKAVRQMPNNPDVSDTLGVVYLKKNLNDSAISLYRDVVQKNPNHPMYRAHFGQAYLQKGDKEQARREFEAALRANPSKADEQKIRDLISKT